MLITLLAWLTLMALLWAPFFWCCCGAATCPNCVGVSYPTTLYLTIGGTDYPLNWNAGSGSWVGSYPWSASVCGGGVSSYPVSLVAFCPNGSHQFFVLMSVYGNLSGGPTYVWGFGCGGSNVLVGIGYYTPAAGSCPTTPFSYAITVPALWPASGLGIDWPLTPPFSGTVTFHA